MTANNILKLIAAVAAIAVFASCSRTDSSLNNGKADKPDVCSESANTCSSAPPADKATESEANNGR